MLQISPTLESIIPDEIYDKLKFHLKLLPELSILIMRIHLLSDLHLESGPYEIPTDLDCDVIVAAGDISNGTKGVEWLKTLKTDVPIIYTAGNHEFWSTRDNPVDMFQIARDIKKSAEGSNVHFLENESVVIGDVRFIGCTLWTNLGSTGASINSGLVDEAKFMNDSCIHCGEFFEDEDLLAEFDRLLKKYFEHARIDLTRQQEIRYQIVESKGWNPIVGLVLHRRSMKFLRKFIHTDAWGDPVKIQPGIKNVIVTHHHPFWKSLLLSGEVSEKTIIESKHFEAHWKRPAENNMYKVAAYASNLDLNNFPFSFNAKHKQSHKKMVTAWLCAHLHDSLDYIEQGIRVCCNPRGRYTHPLTLESAAAMNLFGIGYTEADVLRSKAAHELSPYLGENQEFDPYFVIDVNEGISPVIRGSIESLEPQLIAILNKCKSLSKHCDNNDPEIVATIADKLREKFTEFDRLVNSFDSEVTENTKDIEGNFRFQIYDYWRYEDFENADFEEELDPEVLGSISDAVKFKIEFREFILSRLVFFKSKNLASMKRLLKAESKRDDVIPKKFLRTWDNDF